ncbi:MAG TPA: GNAT family N-acetyltransferase [Methylomirabilota bacterium]|nr:GNAT family N-acetyltransferase [Methylomirabilota bacterium]
MEWTRGEHRITDNSAELDMAATKRLIWSTYWADQRSEADIETSIANSVCVGLFKGKEQIGFARAVTDYSTCSWICDVVVDNAHRGNGLGKWMVETLLAHPKLGRGKQILATRDAHSLYERFGFEPFPCLIRFMAGSQACPVTDRPKPMA